MDNKLLSQQSLAEDLVASLLAELPSYTVEQIAAIASILLAKQWHGEYFTDEDLDVLRTAVERNELSYVYDILLGSTFKMPFFVSYCETTSEYKLCHTRG